MVIRFYKLIFKNSFHLGLIIKILAVFFLLPNIQYELFSPFINSFVTQPNFDPWSKFVTEGGSLISFPYGPVMLIFLYPLSLLENLIRIGFGDINFIFLSGIGIRISLLTFDYFLLLTLRKLLPEKEKEVDFFYWLSPVIIYSTYWHGQLDILPTLLLTISFLLINRKNFIFAGFVLGLSCASKLSMLIAIPFPLIYIWQNKRLRSKFSSFSLSLFFTNILLILIPLFSSGYRKIVIGTNEIKKIFAFNLPLNSDYKLYLMPIAFTILVYTMWRLKRSNFNLMVSITGLSLLISVLMMPPNPGWYAWLIPFLVIYQVNTDTIGKIFITCFTLAAVAVTFIDSTGSDILFLDYFKINEPLFLNESIFFTLIIALGSVLATRIFRESIRTNDYYLLSRKAVFIGISGQEIENQKLLSDSLEDIFGSHSIKKINTLNYRRWDPNSPMWRKLSLNDPTGYDFQKLLLDLQVIRSGRELTLDNKSNQFSNINRFYQASDNSFVLVTGDHLLNCNSIAEKLDLKIYIETVKSHINSETIGSLPEDDLKIDAQKNIYLNEESYSLDQKEKADLVFSISTINKKIDNDDYIQFPIELNIFVADAIYIERLSKALISICGLSINTSINRELLSASITIEGNVPSYDVALAASKLVPEIEEIIDIEPTWKSDLDGVIQLFVLMALNHKIRGL